MRVFARGFLIFFLCSLPAQAGIVVLKNGKRLACEGKYEVVGKFVRFKHKDGRLLQLPLSMVDLERSAEETEKQANPKPKPPPPPKKKAKPEKPFDDELYARVDNRNRTGSISISDDGVDKYAAANPRARVEVSELEESEAVVSKDTSKSTIKKKLKKKPSSKANKTRGMAYFIGHWEVDREETIGQIDWKSRVKKSASNPQSMIPWAAIMTIDDDEITIRGGSDNTPIPYTIEKEHSQSVYLWLWYGEDKEWMRVRQYKDSFMTTWGSTIPDLQGVVWRRKR